MFIYQNNVRFSSRFMTYLVSGSWLLSQCWLQVPLRRVCLKSNQKVIGYSYNIPLLYLFILQAGLWCVSQGLYLDSINYFNSVQSICMYHKLQSVDSIKFQSVGVRFLVRYQLYIFVFSALSFIFSNRALWRAPIPTALVIAMMFRGGDSPIVLYVLTLKVILCISF